MVGEIQFFCFLMFRLFWTTLSGCLSWFWLNIWPQYLYFRTALNQRLRDITDWSSTARLRTWCEKKKNRNVPEQTTLNFVLRTKKVKCSLFRSHHQVAITRGDYSLGVETILCQGALQQRHCQFTNADFVCWTQRREQTISSDLTAAISHQPLSCSTNPFSPSTLLHLPPDILMAQNWPSHYGHIKLKWPPNGIGMIFFKWRESDFCHDRLSPMETTGRESDRWTTFLCQNDVKRKIIIVG